MNNRQPYNTIQDEQLSHMVKDIIIQLGYDTITTDEYYDNEELYDDNIVEKFYDVYDEQYTLWGMSAQQAEQFHTGLFGYITYLMEKKYQEFYDRALKLHNGDEKALYEYLKKVLAVKK